MAVIVIAGLLLVVFVGYGQTTGAEYGYNTPEKALRHLNEGRYDEAREELNRYRREEPDNPLVLYYLARIETDYHKALWWYKEVEILADSSLASEALFQRAELVFSADNLSEAETLSMRLLEEYPGSVNTAGALYRMGIIRLTQDRAEEAGEYFKACRKLDESGEKHLLALTGLMECQVNLENWNEALKTALEALDEHDETSAVTPRILEVIALSWRKLGNDDNAEKFMERLLQNYPYSYQAYALREEGKRLSGSSVYAFEMGNTPSSRPDSDDVPGEISSDKEQARFSVQVGAFSDRTNALRLMRSLKEGGFDVRIDMKTVGEKHLFLIRVGYYPSRDEAEKVAGTVTEAAGIKANVVILE